MLMLILLLNFVHFTIPKSVNELKPSDINCFGVLGDSISAGFSLESHSIFRDLYEYRGKSFPIGGENGFRTIPNLFSNYNPTKKCAAYGSTFITHSILQYPTGTYSGYKIFVKDNYELGNKINCNVAISGALSNELMDMWIKLKVQWLKYSCYDDWKLLTIMIGANDICQYCLNGYNNTIEKYIFNLELLFQNIIKDTQYLFINVISVFDVGLTDDWQNKGCEFVHNLINECPCILGRDKSGNYREIVKNLYRDINLRLYPLVEKYDGIGKLRNIKFVVQPILEDFKIYNFSYLSSLDCFHPSEFGHELMATILWNNMFLPPDKKIRSMPFMLPIHIPTDNEFLQ